MATQLRGGVVLRTASHVRVSKATVRPVPLARRPVHRMAFRSLKVSAVAAPAMADRPPELFGLTEFSGLEGKAMKSALRTDWPEKKAILSVIPEHCFKKDTVKSLAYALVSVALTLGFGALAYTFIPMKLSYIGAWAAYAIAAGTCATGAWVAAHECGHGAFSDNKMIQDSLGYVLHTLLLVPYFSWQRSHAVHHMRTNHVDEGETHVPSRTTDAGAMYKLRDTFGSSLFGLVNSIGVLLLGWPLYLLKGASGGPVRGETNHFWPYAGAKGKHALFPGKWANKALWSDVGILATLGGLAYWAYAAGSIMPVLALYGGPYLVTNAWLVLYTWLQHTDVDVPHMDADQWTWQKGAFMTIDRPYGALCDFLHHSIGSTHVAHHLSHQIPHYHAREATDAIKAAFPELYLYDPTPIWKATLRVAAKCIAVSKDKHGLYVFHPQTPAVQTATA